MHFWRYSFHSHNFNFHGIAAKIEPKDFPGFNAIRAYYDNAAARITLVGNQDWPPAAFMAKPLKFRANELIRINTISSVSAVMG